MEELANDISQRPVRSDWLAYSVMNLMDIRWPAHAPDKDVLDPGYRWLPPFTPADIALSS